ncbi:hypothetical protein QWY77_02045 [Thalassotalea ponticola]|uniref:hypothetical protein n=1 Tax=Thalassotalea ponticola TaxID=1523392 RepID=UPI0025B4E713|nr:hypothetical protein [Thalassotalea ponticola]MDN3651552.1 hypothetical protein [Thalassotalea ponticola]
MTEIIKADKTLRTKLLVFVLIMLSLSLFFQSDIYSNFIRGDVQNLTNEQAIEAYYKLLAIASIFNLAWLFALVTFTFFMVRIAIRAIRESRFPPLDCKVPVDIKVVVGRKAKIQATLIILSVFFLLLTPLFIFSFLYKDYKVMSDTFETLDNFHETLDAHYLTKINEAPNDIESVHYYFELNKHEEAIALLEKLISEGSDRALYAKSIESLVGELLPKDVTKSIDTLTLLCEKYVEPCLRLAVHYRQNKDYNHSLSYFNKAASGEHKQVFREWRYLYNRLNMNDREKLDEYTIKMNQAESYLCDEFYCLTQH